MGAFSPIVCLRGGVRPDGDNSSGSPQRNMIRDTLYKDIIQNAVIGIDSIPNWMRQLEISAVDAERPNKMFEMESACTSSCNKPSGADDSAIRAYGRCAH